MSRLSEGSRRCCVFDRLSLTSNVVAFEPIAECAKRQPCVARNCNAEEAFHRNSEGRLHRTGHPCASIRLRRLADIERVRIFFSFLDDLRIGGSGTHDRDASHLRDHRHRQNCSLAVLRLRFNDSRFHVCRVARLARLTRDLHAEIAHHNRKKYSHRFRHCGDRDGSADPHVARSPASYP